MWILWAQIGYDLRSIVGAYTQCAYTHPCLRIRTYRIRTLGCVYARFTHVRYLRIRTVTPVYEHMCVYAGTRVATNVMGTTQTRV